MTSTNFSVWEVNFPIVGASDKGIVEMIVKILSPKHVTLMGVPTVFVVLFSPL